MSRFYEDEWPHRPKQEDWHSLPRSTRLAAVLWPTLVPKEVQAQMRALSANEQKTDPLTAKVRADQARREQSKTKRR
jgi:hypothetical protein